MIGLCAVHIRFPDYLIFRDGSIISMIAKEPRKLSPVTRGKYPGLSLRNADGSIESIYLHRLMAETFYGAALPGQEVRHLDGAKAHNAAINLRWGTRIENAHDKIAHGTAPIGERHGGAKLRDDDVRLIRQLHGAGAGVRRLAARFGVSPMTVSRIINHQLWRHLNV